MLIKRLLIKARTTIGLLAAYSSFEAYMYVRTRHVIQTRENARSDNDDSLFASAKVNGIFVNPFREYRPQTAFEFLFVRGMELFESLYGNRIEIHEKTTAPDGTIAEIATVLQTSKPDLALIRQNSLTLQACLQSGNFDQFLFGLPAGSCIRNQLLFTWLGQSCSLVQVGGINILTDPIFSNHLFTRHVGPKRLVPSPMTLSDVKFATADVLDVVLVSHNHPDHLEMGVVKDIGNSSLWIVPLGLKAVLERHGVTNVIELDWWQTCGLNSYIKKDLKVTLPDEYEVVCVPAMHWSGRHVVDANTSLWGSFIVRRNGTSILYHAGDTGYSEGLFKAIGEKYSPITLSLLPIGQYCPSWHQKPRHTSPDESIKIAQVTNSLHMMGVHFGTFKLSAEPILQPKERLESSAEALGMTKHYRVPEMGHTYRFTLDDE